MSWQLVSFLILAGVLLAGFAWYERSRPPSQVVALVAALAALAIAGRIAFAAFPNVKPTTDIVIFAGYALGGAPGFAVGALTALVSNFWFGQGPWTPWQMAGWGLCGILGAALALGVRNAGRFTLAATCGGAAVLYGALLNFSLMATYGGDLSWRQFVVYEGRAIPFEVAHLVGNVVLALIAGPAMVRMLIRFRERLEWARRGEVAPTGPGRFAHGLRGGGVAVLAVLVLGLGVLAPAPAKASEVSRAATWLISNQNSDGGFGASPGDDSGAEITCWVMLGLEAAGHNPLDVANGGKTPIDYLRSSLSQVKSPGDLARTILALEGAGVDPREFGGQNLVSKLLAKRRKDGSYEGWPNSTAYAVIALRTAGATDAVDRSLEWLREVQGDDGGWGDLPGSPSTSDTTGAVLQALSPGSKASQHGLAYLREVQRKGGGFPLGGNGEVNSQSTAWSIQGILVAGGNPDSFRRGGASAPEYLTARQAEDGHYRYSKSSDQTPVWVTGEALVAATGKYFPIPPPPREPKPTSSSQSSSGSTGGLVPGTSPVPTTEPAPVSPTESTGAVGGTPSGHSAPQSGAVSGAKPVNPPAGVASGGGASDGAPEETPASSQDSASAATTEPEPKDNGSPAVAALLGIAAGALLFGAAWAARKGWMRWRYGL
ncbi:MAG TPA: prenyltransferase/squalene oxidase repeat-containing protein [Solirubrobacterales bacterium]|nr:prenyltransferase/squalene oxidase repeat-containing protein [Solirubrobacterales bacterium]